MHPDFVSLLAAEHVNDMRAQATAARRAHWARRTRRDRRGPAAAAVAGGGNQPCTDLTARAA